MMTTPWTPSFIAAEGDPHRVVRLRARFRLEPGHGSVASAQLRASALGSIEVLLNGHPISGDLFTPGWTSYEWRLRYAEWAVSDTLQRDNVIELQLGPGWYAGRLSWTGDDELYGQRTAAAADLLITFRDGFEQRVRTDRTWTWAPSSTVHTDFYDGQTIDARVNEPERWEPVSEFPTPQVSFERMLTPPIRRQERVRALRTWRSPAGKLLVDFGQNIVGWTELVVSSARGEQIVVRHAEELENGELGTRPLRTAQATDRYVLSGERDRFEPSFTLHGFRYVQVDGWPHDDVDLAGAMTAIVVGSELQRTGTFASSHDALNQLHANVVWSMRGNFIGVPTDCPQRDERLGWTGDIAVFAPSATFLFDVQDFLTDWLRDVELEARNADGVVPYVVPDVLKLLPGAAGNEVYGSPLPTAIWGDAAVWVPWALYQTNGDLSRLEALYPLIQLHADAVSRALDPDGLWSRGFQFGDWLDPAAPADDPGAARTPKQLVATACAVRTLGIAGDAAVALGLTNDSERYASLRLKVRDAFRAAFLRRGALIPETQTGITLAICFGLLEETEQVQAGLKLAELVRAEGHRIGTGFAGTPYIADALSMTGHIEDAYSLLLQTECPSWLYPVTMGATTIWERWDSKLSDGSINSGEMTSFNHYALGSIADWMHRRVAGLAPGAPGYSTILIEPHPGPGLEWCEATLSTPHGAVSVRWEVVDGMFELQTMLPAPGLLRLPGRTEELVQPGFHVRRCALPSAGASHTHSPGDAAGGAPSSAGYSS